MGYKVKWVEDNLGVTRKALRGFEEAGLMLKNQGRQYRDYDEDDIDRIWTIRVLQGMGYKLKEIVTRVYITADHGFLYTYSPLSEDAKVDKTTPSEQDVEIDRRYLITRKGATPDYLLPVKFMDDGYDAFAPRESVRIKKKGGGLNFVHGGISLQEMVVPVIEYHYLRNDSKTYQRNKAKYDTKPVEVGLLSANRKISNMIFSLNFYQKDAVGDNRSAANYLLYFVDSNEKQISDTAKIIADKTSDNGQERTFRCSFNLKSLKYDNRASYYLVIADETGLQMPQKEEFQIDIAFAVDEFNFFS